MFNWPLSVSVTMEDAVSIYPDHVNSSSSVSVYTSGSHCWEPDGSFHPVCFFVCGMSIVCGIVTVISVYRIVQMVLATIRWAYWLSLPQWIPGCGCHSQAVMSPDDIHLHIQISCSNEEYQLRELDILHGFWTSSVWVSNTRLSFSLSCNLAVLSRF